jgi:peptidoglycan hydrolase CwlO-like protein
VEAQDEIAESRKKFKLMGHQIEQLKEEIAAKDQVHGGKKEGRRGGSLWLIRL